MLIAKITIHENCDAYMNKTECDMGIAEIETYMIRIRKSLNTGLLSSLQDLRPIPKL